MNKSYIELAYKEALKAYKKEEIPVGCVIIYNDKIISKAHNNRQFNNTVLGHAEINAIIKAEKKIKDWRLDGCIMVVTMFPCKMCQHIIEESRISNVYYLYNSDKLDNYDNEKYHRINDEDGILESYKKIMDNFFKKLRK